jgi:hypothetical protein
VVKNRWISVLILLIMSMILTSVIEVKILAAVSYHYAYAAQETTQDTRTSRDDYMSALLERNTDPLGLREDRALEDFLNQASIKWAIRSAKRHILN